jgi:hypothetical protein
MSLVFEAELPDVVIQGGDRTVTAPIQKLVLLALADHASDEGEGAYPSLTRLERKTALGHSSVIRALDALKLAGYITRQGISKRGTVDYSLNLPALESLVPQGHYLHRASVPGRLPLVSQGDSPSVPGTPESSFNHPQTISGPVLPEKTEVPETPGLHSLRAAVGGMGLDRRRREEFTQLVTAAELDGDMLVVHGLGDRAGYYQERWGKSLARQLIGVLNCANAGIRFVSG